MLDKTRSICRHGEHLMQQQDFRRPNVNTWLSGRKYTLTFSKGPILLPSNIGLIKNISRNMTNSVKRETRESTNIPTLFLHARKRVNSFSVMHLLTKHVQLVLCYVSRVIRLLKCQKSWKFL